MKTIIITAALLVQTSVSAKTVKELEIQCSIQAKVVDVTDIKYSPGIPPKFRVPGKDSKFSFKAQLEVLNESQGCELLHSKYKISFVSFNASAGIDAAIPIQQEQILALKNQVLDLQLEQKFGYQSNGFLPLFPLVHSETLNFSFQKGLITGTVPLKFDLNWVYGIEKLESLSDIQKLALAEKVVPFAFQPDFNKLFLELEPTQIVLKKSYALLIWKIFKQKEAGNFLDFGTGGWGSYLGAPLAVALNKTTHIPGMFSQNEIVLLLTDFPSWVLAGYSESQCLNFTAANLEQVLETILVKKQVLTPNERMLMEDALEQISGKFFMSTCLSGKVSENAKQLATEILKK